MHFFAHPLTGGQQDNNSIETETNSTHDASMSYKSSESEPKGNDKNKFHVPMNLFISH